MKTARKPKGQTEYEGLQRTGSCFLLSNLTDFCSPPFGNEEGGALSGVEWTGVEWTAGPSGGSDGATVTPGRAGQLCQ